uniref:Uncharacterized protein n=1 Tax=Megaselia scalaris TaxID=36166 RepID=T1GHY3_MEGSC
MKLYLPCEDWICNPGLLEGSLVFEAHVSTTMLTSSNSNVIGTLFNFVQLMRKETWLHHADFNLSHVGSSSRSVRTFSSNSRFDNCPSPRNVLKLILSGERFFM